MNECSERYYITGERERESDWHSSILHKHAYGTTVRTSQRTQCVCPLASSTS